MVQNDTFWQQHGTFARQQYGRGRFEEEEGLRRPDVIQFRDMVSVGIAWSVKPCDSGYKLRVGAYA